MVISDTNSRHSLPHAQATALILSSLVSLMSGCWKVSVEPDVEPIMIEFHQSSISPSNSDRGLSAFLYTFPNSTGTMVRLSQRDSVGNDKEVFFTSDRESIVRLVRTLDSIGLFSLPIRGEDSFAIVDYDRRTNITIFCGEKYWGNVQPFQGCIVYPVSHPTPEETDIFARSAARLRTVLEELNRRQVFSQESPEAKLMHMWLVERLRGHPFDSASVKRRQHDPKWRELYDKQH